MRHCANPSCRRPIDACFGFVKAGDMVEALQGNRTWQEVRELCGKCGLKIAVLEDDEEGLQKFLIEIGYLNTVAPQCVPT